ncbi:MAG: hypothetical protein ACLVFI_09160 [Christensenellales bacterium]
MIYLALAILCSSGVSLSIRYAEQHSGRMKSVTVVNYIASVFWCFYFLPDKHLYPAADGQAFVLVLSIINGCLYLGTLLLQQVNIRKNGTTISASFSHMGVLVPTVLSIFLFGEYPGRLQWVGVALALAAILILNIQGRADKEKANSKIWLVFLLISGGCADMMSKIFERYGNHRYESHFLFYTFVVALFLSAVWIVYTKEWPSYREVLYGLVMGSFNYLSTMFLLKSVLRLPAFLVYPVYSVGVILFVNVVNFLFLKERLQKKDCVAMACISAALVLMGGN